MTRSLTLRTRHLRRLLITTSALALVVACAEPQVRTVGHAPKPAPVSIEQLAVAKIDTGKLANMRGGMMINGIDVTIGYVIQTVAGNQRLTTSMNVNNNGVLTPVIVQPQILPPTPPNIVAPTPPTPPTVVAPIPPNIVAPTPPNIAAPTPSHTVTPTQPAVVTTTTGGTVMVASVTPATVATTTAAPSSAASTTAAPSSTAASGTSVTVTGAAPVQPPPGFSVSGLGTSKFQATLGDPNTTQIVHQLTGNSISTIVANRANDVSISTTSTLNVTVNNLSSLSNRLLAIPFINGMGRDIASFRLK